MVKQSTDQTTTKLNQKIRRIEIRTSKLVNDLFGGRYLSTFKGRGMEFLDVREYIPGDDIRNIHWNITARLGSAYVKRFTEERELTILVAVDVSRSLHFGTRGKLKSELAAELISILAFSALKNNDKIGLLLFSNETEKYIPPRKSKSHVLRMIKEVLNFEPKNPRTHLSSALQTINKIQKKRAVVFLISDFLDDDYITNLKITRRRHDTIAFILEDAMETSWPAIGKILLEDAETGKRVLAQGGSSQSRALFSSTSQFERQRLISELDKNNVDNVVFKTNEDMVSSLIISNFILLYSLPLLE